MKNLSMILATATMIVLTASCGGSKKTAPTQGAKEVNVPCTEYFSDAKFFRGAGNGKSHDLNTARLKAHTTASAELAASINQQIKRVVEQYTNDMEVNSKMEFGQSFEALTTTVVNQSVSNTQVACNKTMQEKDGSYSVYMALEVNKDEFMKTLEDAATQDKKINLLYDREKFREKYNQEMEAFASQR
jgi:hypothetical protein